MIENHVNLQDGVNANQKPTNLTIYACVVLPLGGFYMLSKTKKIGGFLKRFDDITSVVAMELEKTAAYGLASYLIYQLSK